MMRAYYIRYFSDSGIRLYLPDAEVGGITLGNEPIWYKDGQWHQGSGPGLYPAHGELGLALEGGTPREVIYAEVLAGMKLNVGEWVSPDTFEAGRIWRPEGAWKDGWYEVVIQKTSPGGSYIETSSDELVKMGADRLGRGPREHSYVLMYGPYAL